MDLFLFIIAVVGVLAVITLFRISKGASASMKKVYKRTAWASLAVAIICALLSVTTVVAPRTVGVVVQFGQPVQALNNGLHFKTPWSNVEFLDGAVQNDVYNDSTNPLPVRLKNNSQATADASIQWQLKSDNAMGIFLDHRTFENIQQNLVDRNFRDSINQVMADYDPLTNSTLNEDDENALTLQILADRVLADMKQRIGADIDVRSVTIPIINFDAATQTRIDELQSEIAKTRIAEQKQKTSAAEAAANRELESSLSDNVLTSKCLDIISEKGLSPIGCFPGADVTNIKSVE